MGMRLRQRYHLEEIEGGGTEGIRNIKRIWDRMLMRDRKAMGSRRRVNQKDKKVVRIRS